MVKPVASEQHPSAELTDIHFYLTDESPEEGARQWPYDMTQYIKRPDLREKDSKYMARVFDKQWSRFKSDETKYSQDYLDIPFKETFFGVRRCLQFLKTPEDIIHYYFKMCQITMPNSIDDILNSSLRVVIPFFSHMKAYIHKHIDNLPPISYCYSELDTIAGYPKEEHRAQTDDSEQWLNEDVPDIHTSKWWADQIFTLLIRCQKINQDEPLMSLYQFLSKPWLWVTSGASAVSRLTLDGGKVRSKFGAALSLTTDELLGCVIHACSPKSTNIDIFIKPDERGFKRRLIANMDLGSYLIAAYIRYLLEWLDGVVPHWMTATTTPDLDVQVSQLLREGRTAMPLDESQFDHHLARAAWLGFLSAMDTIFPNNFGVHLFHVMFANSHFFDRSTNKHGLWTKGMPSGLAITALGNTLFNYIKQQAIISPIHFALGDDVLLFNDQSLEDISKYYESFGAELNPKKNWKSINYAEYLHFLYSKYGRVGLPARIYGSLIYGLKFKDVSPLQRINELTMMFKDFYDRAVLPFDEQLVAADLSRAVSSRWAGFSSVVAKQWLHIPKAVNGFGLLPYVYRSFDVKNTEYHTKYYDNNLYPLPPVREVSKSEWKITSLHLNQASFSCGNIFHLPKIETIEDWINSLNFTRPGISRTIQEYGMSQIPLPELPYVSTTRMALFAQMWKFNAYPNLSGSVVSRTTRFIKGSILLAQAVMQWMKDLNYVVYV